MCRGLHRTVEERLVDIAQPEPERCEGIQDLFRDPAGVTDFDDQRIFVKALLESPEVLPVLRFVLERPRELDQNRSQSVGLHDRSHS
jgi:hypothetical protein